MGLSGVAGIFRRNAHAVRTLGGIDLRIPTKRVCNIVNTSNTNGDALVHYMGLLRHPARNDILISNRRLAALSRSRLAGTHHRVNVVFRRFGLLSSHAIFNGITLPLRLSGAPGSRVGHHIARLLSLINLNSGRSDCPSGLSNKRGRHITVTHTLTDGPGMLLYSRTADTLSPTAAHSVLRLLGSVGHHLNLAVLLVARRVSIIGHVYSYITIVDGNRLVRRSAMDRIFSRPGAPLTRGFVRSALRLSVPRSCRRHLRTRPFASYIPVLHLRFANRSISTPLLSRATHHFGIGGGVVDTRVSCTNNIGFNVVLARVRNARRSARTTVT